MQSILGIRLADGTNTSGRVELFHNGNWGAISADFAFYGNDNAATVICNNLGFKGHHMTTRTYFGPFTGDILLEELTCDGTELSIEDCQHRGFSPQGKPWSYAAVLCSIGDENG